MALYDSIAEIYDPWSASVVEDIAFYVEEARRCGGPVVELAVGSGRIAVPIAQAGLSVIGVDLSDCMLAVARALAEEHGVASLVDLRVGDLRKPPVDERVPLVICPFRSLLHMPDEAEKLSALRAAHTLLEPGGQLVFDVFAPSREDIAQTQGLWLEREPGIFERADWDESSRTLRLSVRSGDAAAAMELHWLSAIEWRRLIEEAGFDVAALYGWFDRRPYRGGEDMIWVCRAAEDAATEKHIAASSAASASPDRTPAAAGRRARLRRRATLRGAGAPLRIAPTRAAAPSPSADPRSCRTRSWPGSRLGGRKQASRLAPSGILRAIKGSALADPRSCRKG